MKRTNLAMLLILGGGIALAALPVSNGATAAASRPQESPIPYPTTSGSPMPSPTMSGSPMP